MSERRTRWLQKLARSLLFDQPSGPSSPLRLSSRRSIHSAPSFGFDISEGIQPFLSAQTLRILSIDYQQGLLDRLNDCVRGGPLERSSIVQTIIETAPDRNQALAFSYASSALNNAFFLSRLRPQAADLSDTSRLYNRIRDDFGSLLQFKDYFSSAAMGMSGSGYIWLIMDNTGRLGVIGTFGNGTVLVQSRMQRGDHDAVVHSLLHRSLPQRTEDSSQAAMVTPEPTTNEGSTLHSSEGRPALYKMPDQLTFPSTWSLSRRVEATKGVEGLHRAKTMQEDLTAKQDARYVDQLHPLLCLSIHERCWLADHGVWGKEEYLKRFWEAIDWTKVTATYERLQPEKSINHILPRGT